MMKIENEKDLADFVAAFITKYGNKYVWQADTAILNFAKFIYQAKNNVENPRDFYYEDTSDEA